jgi:hypothetical protein
MPSPEDESGKKTMSNNYGFIIVGIIIGIILVMVFEKFYGHISLLDTVLPTAETSLPITTTVTTSGTTGTTGASSFTDSYVQRQYKYPSNLQRNLY